MLQAQEKGYLASAFHCLLWIMKLRKELLPIAGVQEERPKGRRVE